MFRWYESAGECFVYLSDVSCEESDLCTVEEMGSWSDRNSAAKRFWMDNDEDLTSLDVIAQTSVLRTELTVAFQASEWFTRGWTLQELLAPTVLRFVDRDWKGIFGAKLV